MNPLSTGQELDYALGGCDGKGLTVTAILVAALRLVPWPRKLMALAGTGLRLPVMTTFSMFRDFAFLTPGGSGRRTAEQEEWKGSSTAERVMRNLIPESGGNIAPFRPIVQDRVFLERPVFATSGTRASG